MRGLESEEVPALGDRKESALRARRLQLRGRETQPGRPRTGCQHQVGREGKGVCEHQSPAPGCGGEGSRSQHGGKQSWPGGWGSSWNLEAMHILKYIFISKAEQ